MSLRNFAKSLAVLCIGISAISNQAIADDKLKSVISGDHRTAQFVERDQYRHPYETLQFFGLKDNMTVVELSPGGGWYTEILAPYLKDNGTYIAAGYDPESSSEYYSKNAKNFAKKMADSPKLYGKAQISIFEAPNKIKVAEPNSADMVVSFRNAHHWHRKGHADAIYAEIFKALKPGGIFGIVQHRAGWDFPKDQKGNMGYLPQKEVIAKIKAAGFRLLESSEINANPKDKKDHPNGVWTLPPSLSKLKTDEDKAKYKAIGESDRMTLKFVKPAKM